ncbi:MAG: DUF1993 domain-containing protein [Gammaproteobacteria bacterium]
MKTSMYQTAIPTFTRVLNNLVAILEKGAAHAEARKIEPAALLNARLYPDMFPLSRQVQLTTESAISGVSRIAGVEVPTYENNESSFADLVARIRKTITQLEAIKPEQLDGTEDKTVTWQTRSSTKHMLGLPYLLNHTMPNVFFHATTAYNILRHNGVEVGKMDYLGRN